MRAPTIDRLFVLWREPDTGRRTVVGHLARTSGEFRFWYEADVAAARGFALLPTFPEQRLADAPYEARYLWSAFADRIPSPRRPDSQDILQRWGVERADDQFEILARSGGLRATDRIELAEYRAADDPLSTPLEFRIAGGRYAPMQAIAIAAGDDLTLEREPLNEFDQAATLILVRDGQRAGYVPKQYSALIARLLDNGVSLDVTAVRALLIPEDDGRWVVRATRSR